MKTLSLNITAQKMKFSIKDFFSKCEQIRSFLPIRSHLQKKWKKASVILLIKTYCLKDTHKKKAPSKKTPMLSKRMNTDIWVFGTSKQLLIRGS